MISAKKKLEIANICYANVAGDFAMFTNPKYQGPNFTWNDFAEVEVDRAGDWMFIHNVRGNKEEIKKQARIYAKEIADRLLARAGL